MGISPLQTKEVRKIVTCNWICSVCGQPSHLSLEMHFPPRGKTAFGTTEGTEQQVRALHLPLCGRLLQAGRLHWGQAGPVLRCLPQPGTGGWPREKGAQGKASLFFSLLCLVPVQPFSLSIRENLAVFKLGFISCLYPLF